jgi:hypothetical protein
MVMISCFVLQTLFMDWKMDVCAESIICHGLPES